MTSEPSPGLLTDPRLAGYAGKLALVTGGLGFIGSNLTRALTALGCRVTVIDSMEPGGTLRIDLQYAEGMAQMAFADDGCGMSAEILENIFEPFFTRRRVGKGTGLGLSITHRIVSQPQGEVTASSPGEGQGSTFTVRLPLRPAEAAPAPAPAQEVAAA